MLCTCASGANFLTSLLCNAGLWLNIPDYDAPTQMVKPKERNERYVDAVLTIPKVGAQPQVAAKFLILVMPVHPMKAGDAVMRVYAISLTMRQLLVPARSQTFQALHIDGANIMAQVVTLATMTVSTPCCS